MLHVDYGAAPDKMGLEWGRTTGEYLAPASADKMRVVGDRFYFIDATVNRIKQFRSPGTLVWESEPFFNLGYYAVAPDGRVYVIWDAAIDKLSCLDNRGRLLWTRDSDDFLPPKRRLQWGFSSKMIGLYGLEWTTYGLTATIIGTDRNGKRGEFAVLVTDEGREATLLPGQLVGADGTIYDFKLSNRRGGLLEGPMVGRNRAGKVVRQVAPAFAADNRVHLAGDRSAISRVVADPVGGFTVELSARLPARIRLTSRLDTGLEEVMWRFDVRGNFREQWRLPSTKFASHASQVVVGSDGNVYYLRFGETGIYVIKYSRTSK